MQKLITVCTIIIILIILGALALKMVSQNLQFTFSYVDTLITPQFLDRLILGGQKNAILRVRISIRNDNSFSITARNVRVSVFYKNKLVLISREIQSVIIPSNTITSYIVDSDTVINNNTVDLLKQLVINKADIKYEATFKVFNIPASNKDIVTDLSIR